MKMVSAIKNFSAAARQLATPENCRTAGGVSFLVGLFSAGKTPDFALGCILVATAFGLAAIAQEIRISACERAKDRAARAAASPNPSQNNV